MAGAGVRQDMILGETDEYGWQSIDGKVHVHDLRNDSTSPGWTEADLSL